MWCVDLYPLVRCAVPAAAAFTMTFAMGGIASADTGTNVPLGTGSAGSGPGFGYTNRNGSSNGVYVGGRTGTLAGGYCRDSLFDWATENRSHYDARAVRAWTRARGSNYYCDGGSPTSATS